MKIQQIVVNGGAERELYFKGGSPRDGAIFIPAGEKISFDTYFNSFSYTKYKKYSVISEITFRADFKGRAKVSLRTYNGKTERVICEKDACDGALLCVNFSDLDESAFLFPVIEATEDTFFLSGGYYAEAEEKSIRAAIAICTYKREEYLKRNLEILSRADIRSLGGIIVVDNGNTLSAEDIEKGKISLFKNKNFGGSAGFTRGIMEAHKAGYTHVILMDDDVIIFPEAISRTLTFLSILRPEYENAHISAAMLPTSDIRIQHEMGALWNGSRIESINSGLDLTKRESLITNLESKHIMYGAWWCFCLPLTDKDNFGLPLPLFIKFDDVEYGMRCCREAPIITMSGIAVAHADFNYKYNLYLEYYTVRNQLITLASHNMQNRFGCLLRLIKVSAKHLFMYRYVTSEIILRAFDDFLKGPEFLMNTDAEELNRSVMAMAPKPIRLSDTYDIEKVKSEYKPKKKSPILIALGILTLGTHLLPSFLLPKKESFAPLPTAKVYDCFMRKNTVQYQVEGDYGYVFKKNSFRFFSCFFSSFVMGLKLLFRYGKVKKAYRESFSTLTSEEFWAKYLGLDKE